MSEKLAWAERENGHPDVGEWRCQMEAYVRRHGDLRRDDLGACARAVAVARDGLKGAWAYGVWDDINESFYDGRLEDPLILWIATEWGGCLGDTTHRSPVLIRLHPGLMFTADQTSYRSHTPWQIPPEYRGYGLVAEVILHEAMHVAIEQAIVSADQEGPWRSSHDNPEWVAECNRIAQLLGLDLDAKQPHCVREPIPGTAGKRGKPRTKPVWTKAGNVSMKALGSFPYGVRRELGLADFYAQYRQWLPSGAMAPDSMAAPAVWSHCGDERAGRYTPFLAGRKAGGEPGVGQ